MTSTSASILFRRMNGVFAVYKHADKSVATLAKTVLHKILYDLDSLEQRPQKAMVKYVPRKVEEHLEGGPSSQTAGLVNLDKSFSMTEIKSLAERVPVNVADWFDHPLVQGPRFNLDDFELSVGQILDRKSSGIQLFGLQSRGQVLLEKMKRYRIPRSYHLHGRFGQASTKFDGEGRVIERSTWDHITEPKISRLLCMIQGTYRNALMKSSNLDMDSQHAYEMACKGLLRPQMPTGLMILDLKLKKLELPDFIVDVTCINESCQHLRKLVHEIGLELRSSAVCLKVRRYRDGVLFAEDESTLLPRDVTAQKTVDAMAENHDKLFPLLARKPSVFLESSISNMATENEFSEDQEAVS